MPNLIMNEVNIFNGIQYNYTEEQLFNKLCNMYKNTPIKNISSLWFHTYYTFMNCLIENLEDAYNENRNNREELENYIYFRRLINDTNLLIIKNYESLKRLGQSEKFAFNTAIN